VRVFAALALLAGCGLPSDPSKDACRTQDDCVTGYTCTLGRCELPSADGAMSSDGGVDGSADGAVAPTCTDGAKNGSESGVDCGGSCGACADGTTCNGDGDCATTSTCASSILSGGQVCLPGRWQSRSPIPATRINAGVAVSSDGRIFVVGGTSSTAVYVYDPVMDSWSTAASMIAGGDSISAAFGSDGRLYAVGGKLSAQSDQDVRVQSYDSMANTWRSEPSLNAGRTWGTVTASGARLYAVGGEDFSVLHDVGPLESFAPGDGSWATDTVPMNTPRDMHAATLLADGRIFAVGGASDSLTHLDSAEIYDPAQPGWTTAASMGLARNGLGAATIGSRVYVLGGNCQLTACAHNLAPDTEVYDTSTHAWSLAAPMPTPRESLGVAVVGGVIYTFGGDGPNGNADATTVEAFTP